MQTLRNQLPTRRHRTRSSCRTACMVLAASSLFAAVAQNPIPLALPFVSPNQGNVGGGVYFDLTVHSKVTLNFITYVASDTSPAGVSSFDMYVGPNTWVGNVTGGPGPWVHVASSIPVAIPGGGVDTPVVGVLFAAGVNPPGSPITFAPGSYGIALQAVGHSWGYTNGSFVFPGPTGFPPDVVVSTGGASNAFLAGPTFTPRTLNGLIDYGIVPADAPMPIAQRDAYGKGCYSRYRSFYEFMPNTATGQDLSFTSMFLTFDPVGNRYSSITPGVTPVNVAAVVSPPLGHLDDSNIVVPLAAAGPIVFPNIGGPGVVFAVSMCSNMYVNLLGVAPPIATPTVAAWLTGPSVRIGNHHDVDPSAGGTTHYDFDPITMTHLFTWLAVPDWNIAGTMNTFQLAFWLNGDVEFRWGAMSLAGGGAWPTLVGFSPGAISLDPGSTDLSARLPMLPLLATADVDRPPLRLTADVNPVLGAAVMLTTSDETGASLGLCALSLANLAPFSPVGLELTPFGAPECVNNVNTSAGVLLVIGNVPGLSMAVPLAIPLAAPALIGVNVYAQSMWVDPLGQNAFFGPGLGLLTSNAQKLKVGMF